MQKLILELKGEKRQGVENDLHSHHPYFPDVGVIALVPDEWDSPWQPRHQILSRLSRYFNVVWCTPAPTWRTWWRGNATRIRQVNYGSPPHMGFFTYRPETYLPRIGRPHFLARWTEQQRLKKAHRILLNQGCRKTILYIWRPGFKAALDLLNYDVSCYHIDDEYTFSELDQALSAQEKRLLERVDQVFIHSPALLAKKGSLNRHTEFVPNGVDYQFYATLYQEPDDLAGIPRPRIGYTGRIKMQLDWPLIDYLTTNNPQWSFVFVGPEAPHAGIVKIVKHFNQKQNVFFLGPKPVLTLTQYPQHFDVCIMPYRQNDYTKYIYPLKLHEYLASGRPVVGSQIESLRQFEGILALPQTSAEWSYALKDALLPESTCIAKVTARRDIARQYDWNRLVRLIASKLCERLGPVYFKRITEIAPPN